MIRDDHPDALHLLAAIAHEMSRNELAVELLRRAIALQPNVADYHNTLGIVFDSQRQHDRAVGAYESALRVSPHHAAAHNNLGSALCDLGLIDSAIASFRRAVNLRPEKASYLSNLIYSLHIQPTYPSNSIHTEVTRWNDLYCRPLAASSRRHTNDRSPARRLRIGYVSPDLREHAVAFFLTPLLEAHDREQFSICCYASVSRPDAITGKLRKCAEVWRDSAALSDSALAGQVRSDGIDILIDLSMHTAGNRLPAFALRPAPVQVSWLAYPGSTGLEVIEYRLTDAFIEPPAEVSVLTPELPIRLPDAWCCYQPIGYFPEVGDLPAERAGYVTFGSLNKLSKVNDRVMHCWAELLRALPDSRLLMLCPEGRSRERIREYLATRSVDAERVEFVSFISLSDYLKTYQRIDIALDPFPCNGMTTTCHALWMGVPVVTLPGTTAISRAGLSLLSNAGLPELVAASEDHYVTIATGLACDLTHLAGLRATLRARMAKSPLMDAPKFARHFEQALRGMWQKWCGT